MKNIQELIRLNLEIEGLLRIIAARDSAEAKEMLYTKIGEFITLVDAPEQLVQDEEIESPQEPEMVITGEISQSVEPVEQEINPAEDKEIESVSESLNIEVEVPEEVQLEEAKREEDMPSDTRPSDLRLDEAITRREAKNLRKAFTLNDKFRFRRELFCNNDPLFINTLDDISGLTSIDEATKYLTDKFGWDMDNEDVKDFVAIISNHFA